jgi:hypothetical protein
LSLASLLPNRCFISRGYDATSHFETEINDVLDMYQRITGGGGGTGRQRVFAGV